MLWSIVFQRHYCLLHHGLLLTLSSQEFRSCLWFLLFFSHFSYPFIYWILLVYLLNTFLISHFPSIPVSTTALLGMTSLPFHWISCLQFYFPEIQVLGIARLVCLKYNSRSSSLTPHCQLDEVRTPWQVIKTNYDLASVSLILTHNFCFPFSILAIQNYFLRFSESIFFFWIVDHCLCSSSAEMTSFSPFLFFLLI